MWKGIGRGEESKQRAEEYVKEEEEEPGEESVGIMTSFSPFTLSSAFVTKFRVSVFACNSLRIV